MSEGQIADLIWDREIKAGEVTGDATLPVGTGTELKVPILRYGQPQISRLINTIENKA